MSKQITYGDLTLALFALSGSGIVGFRGLLLVLALGGLIAAGLVLMVPKLWPGANATTSGARSLAASDAHDLIRMDSDMG
jgi:hypothetical protein